MFNATPNTYLEGMEEHEIVAFSSAKSMECYHTVAVTP